MSPFRRKKVYGGEDADIWGAFALFYALGNLYS
jgi:hypothetical protein